MTRNSLQQLSGFFYPGFEEIQMYNLEKFPIIILLCSIQHDMVGGGTYCEVSLRLEPFGCKIQNNNLNLDPGLKKKKKKLF